MKQLLIFGVLFSFALSALASEEGFEVSLAEAKTTLEKLRVSKNQQLRVPEVANAVQPALESCEAAATRATYACLAQLSEHVQTGGAALGGILTVVSAMKNNSTAESCKKYNSAMKIAEMAVAGYNTACAATMMMCQSSCKKAEEAINSGITQVKAKATTDVSADHDMKVLGPMKAPVAKQIGVCKQFKLNLAVGIASLTKIIAEAMNQKTCETATTVLDCSKTPDDPKCRTTIDCSVEANQNDSQCICQRMPGSPGCPGASGAAGGFANTGTDGTTDGVNRNYGDAKIGGGTDYTNAAIGGGDGSGGGGSAMGAGSGGGGGGGLGGGASGKAGAADSKAGTAKGLNTNILSGYDGGGGGGGSRGGSGRMDSAYKAYLPGGAKDPGRGVASKTFGNGEVTSSGSKSNWEKVSERYKENKPTLMGQ